MRRFALVLAVACAAVPGIAQQNRNPQIDYRGFQRLAAETAPHRETRLVTHARFREMARDPRVLILDARSADAYAAGHIKGAVNLPFTDFTAESLARVIGDKGRPILIYCNNNFANDRPPVMRKMVQLALNIQTFINLVGYGYNNVRELDEVVDFTDPKIGWVKGKSPRGNAAA